MLLLLLFVGRDEYLRRHPAAVEILPREENLGDDRQGRIYPPGICCPSVKEAGIYTQPYEILSCHRIAVFEQ